MRELKKGNTWTGEVCFQRRNGSTFPAFVTNAPIYDELQQLTGIIGISSDISEKRFLQQQILEQQKRTEQKLIQARNNAEAANESKSKFLASMSHELRTPLNAVIGFSKILKSSDLSKEQQGEFLEYIESSGNMLLKLIGDILEISKIEAGKLTIQQEPFLFAETINSALNPYRFKANEKGIEFSISIDSSIPQQVIGDAYITNQILVNLLGNAIKFTKEGKINVAISRLQNVESSDDTVWLQFLIQDTGIGIDKEKGQRIFETFTQADNTIAREFGGSGLGLSIVRRLVLLMGGTIGVKTPGTKLSGKGGPGSVFELILPYTTNAEAVSSNDDEKAIKGNFSFTDLNILVVEDNLMNQKLALHTFSKLGCKVAIAVNGQEAIKMLLHESYSLVFMDLQMPVMDGYEATKIIRNELRSDITIIGLTANAFKEDKESCLTAGMNDFVSKPYTSEQLQQVIIKWLNKNSS
jgi:signal transduction histidine kinase